VVGVRNEVGAIDFHFSTPIQTGPGTHPTSSTVGNAVLFRGERARVWH